eukprot:3883154-Rhodomonas_salina.1
MIIPAPHSCRQHSQMRHHHPYHQRRCLVDRMIIATPRSCTPHQSRLKPLVIAAPNSRTVPFWSDATPHDQIQLHVKFHDAFQDVCSAVKSTGSLLSRTAARTARFNVINLKVRVLGCIVDNMRNPAPHSTAGTPHQFQKESYEPARFIGALHSCEHGKYHSDQHPLNIRSRSS